MEINNEVPKQKSNGALIGSIIIIVILIIGGVYLAQNKIKEAKEQEKINAEQASKSADVLSTSDEVSDIEADLNKNADVNSLDKGLE